MWDKSVSFGGREVRRSSSDIRFIKLEGIRFFRLFISFFGRGRVGKGKIERR